VHVAQFKRFVDLTIQNIPTTARLVVLAGPNGSGKSSLFEAFLMKYRSFAGLGPRYDVQYIDRPGIARPTIQPWNRVQISFDPAFPTSDRELRKVFYIRSAYRNDPEFRIRSLTRMPAVTDTALNRMIDADVSVSTNYQRIASRSIEDVLVHESASTTIGEYRERVVGEIRRSVAQLFPDLIFTDIGNPIDDGTFRFTKGTSFGFEYVNLSAGEKAAFDLLLDMIVKRRDFTDTIYCIDEPEAHLNARIQATLIRELYNLLPSNSQMWLATHSIGMMREARELSDQEPGSVTFLNFGDRNFDMPTTIEPEAPTRIFWESVLSVAIDDLSKLVAPKEVIVCEGSPISPIAGNNAAFDAECYNTIFALEKPDAKFLSGGSSREVKVDRLGFVAGIQALVDGISVRRLIDRDAHTPSEIAGLNANGIAVLSRRHIESYLFDDEVLEALCVKSGRPDVAPALLGAKEVAIRASENRGNAQDDMKSAAGEVYSAARRLLQLTAAGSDTSAFAKFTLAPLVQPGMRVYAALKADIFGA
jgi:energy-coupling factor transporter ATP-binding protein EcfA2